jgi:hypothetical protein
MNMDVEYGLTTIATVKLQELHAYRIQLSDEHGHQAFGALEKRRHRPIVEFEQVTCLAMPGDDKSMPGGLRESVKKGQYLIVLIDTMTGQFTTQDPGKHIVLIIVPVQTHNRCSLVAGDLDARGPT